MISHLEKFQKKLKSKGDAALITSPQNQFYLSVLPMFVRLGSSIFSLKRAYLSSTNHAEFLINDLTFLPQQLL